ncbi:cell wall-binding repeat-containing protein [Bacillus aquiflavi]|uniref:Cell wall-binding repeat-containing protein n=2 Tax=Bacillus aquiflavi TaxID=2672567 RepID=A0A6B3VU41_9BACI|nr:cell wall-binding repeat-containing protein [Bacillus aquiflavi]NEY80738.1 S8 family serine peptidase [Bacillus aquiflavi]UAC50124.1 cell wall-binding repeat-containing protein [Bacillus aquiflavi]
MFGHASLALGAETKAVQKTSLDEIQDQILNKLNKDKTKNAGNLQKENIYKANDSVRIIVEAKGETPLEAATKKGVMYKELSNKEKASLNKAAVAKQKDIKSAIKSKGININVFHEFSTSFIGFSGKVKYKDIKKIENIDGVKNVYIANEYERPTPDMLVSHEFIESYQTWGDAGYKGEGMVISVIDSGVDPAHNDFILNETTEEALTEEKVEQVISKEGLPGQFFTEKVPYGYNYYDKNKVIKDEGPAASEHGMHVAGTVGANGDPENDGIKGVAPEAQILGMKVFSNDPNAPSTYSDIYLKAIDDSIKLGADVLNMSLGSVASFYQENSPEDVAITRAVQNGVVASVSAGNSAHIGNNWDNPYFNNPDIGVVGSPGLNKDTIQVAASGNLSIEYIHQITLAGTSYSGLGYGIDSWEGLEGLEVVSLAKENGKKETPGKNCTVCGDESDYKDVNVKDKVVLVKRGGISFYDKTRHAYNAGAKAIIVYDTGLSQFYTDQGGWGLPFMMISAGDGEALENEIAAGNINLTVTEDSAIPGKESGRITGFSSWGTTPSLELKPEITAPGGNIYSTLQDNQYGTMSGTSMAAPHVAGGAALVQQYLKEEYSDLNQGERTRLAKKLLMNTAKIIEDLHGQPYSPRSQGAGMMQTFAAVTTPVYVVAKDTGEAKVELKDFTEKSFSMDFTAINDSEDELTYKVDTRVLTDTFLETDGPVYNALIAGDMEGAKVTAPDEVKIPAGESVDFTISIDLSEATIPGIDENGDEVTEPLREDIFVEGFVTLSPVGELNPVLSVPYVGFYGKWDRPNIVDGFKGLNEERYFDLDTLFEEKGTGEMLETSNGRFVSPVEYGDVVVYPLSPNGDGYYDDIYPLPSFLRNAKEVQFNILDKNGKHLRRIKTESFVRKTYFNPNNNKLPISFDPDRSWDGTVKKKVINDGLYFYEIKAAAHQSGAKWQSKKIPVYLDTTAPEVTLSYNKASNELSYEVVEKGIGVEAIALIINDKLIDLLEDTSGKIDLEDNSGFVQIAAIDKASNIGISESISVNDSEKPVLFVDENIPAPFSSYHTLSVPVKGYVTDNVGIKSVTINGVETEVNYNNSNGRYEFDGEATFDKDGQYDVIVTTTDHAGNEYSINRIVFVDTTPAEMTIDVPAVVNVDQVEAKVTLKDNFNKLSLYVDDEHLLDYESTEKALSQPIEKEISVPLNVAYGKNTYEFKAVDLGGNTTTKKIEISRSKVSRLSGTDRFETAAAISQNGWETSDVIVLARSGDYQYADALAGAPLAHKYDAPLLLTATDQLPATIEAEIDRLQAKTVYILGGDGAVSSTVEKALKDKGLTVQRLAGENRFETAAKIANEVAASGVKEAVVVDAYNFPDALSAASYAAKRGMPILLTSTTILPDETKTALNDNKITKTYVIGGEAIINNDILKELPDPSRIFGQDRYETSVELAHKFRNGQSHYYIATGFDFADALAGAALAAKGDTGILLVSKVVPDSVAKFISENDIKTLTILGGEGVVSQDTAAKLNDLLK